MSEEPTISNIQSENIKSLIYEIRGQKVMLDSDLADMYEVEVSQLKRQVRRNIDRFPQDFMFELTPDEVSSLRCQNGIIKTGRGQHSKYAPFAFTEEGVAMLSGLLRSKIAIQGYCTTRTTSTASRSRRIKSLPSRLKPSTMPSTSFATQNHSHAR